MSVNKGEIDTKPMESVKVAVSLLQNHHYSASSSSDKGTRSSGLLKELSTYKIQLEAKESERLELLRKLDYYQSTQSEMLNIQVELLALKDENRKALARADSERGRVEELESQLEDARVAKSRLKKDYEQSLEQVRMMEAGAQGEMLNIQVELLALKDENRKALAMMDTERGRADELEKQLEDARVAKLRLKKDYEQSLELVRIMEVGKVKKELESAKCKVGELRGRAEQAATRADAAERGRAEAEMEVRKVREKKEKRKAALVALREESLLIISSKSADHSYHQPLGKFLNLTH